MKNIINSTLSKEVFNYCLQNAKTDIVQKAIKENNLRSIAYSMKMELVGQFPELRGEGGSIGLNFGLIASEAFDKYKVADHILATELVRKIDAKFRLLKLIGKQHPDFMKHALEHDSLVELSNVLQEPINQFLRLYKLIQKSKGRKISIRRKKQTI